MVSNWSDRCICFFRAWRRKMKMGYNEQGFVYPLTLIISLFVTVFITYQIHAYSTEKYVLHEQERLMQLQSLLHVAIHEFNMLEENRPHHERSEERRVGKEEKDM